MEPERYGKWLVLADWGRLIINYKNHTGLAKLCVCDCGTFRRVTCKNLNNGTSKSCGCSVKTAAKTHGMQGTQIYEIWASMKNRCTNPKKKDYKYYGGRGITVCEEWKNSFENFYKDMGDCPEGMSLDRIDTNGNYELSNCKWSTKKEQSFNTRKRVNNTSGRTGVKFVKSTGKWYAAISVNYKTISSHHVDSFEEALKLREEFELLYHGKIRKQEYERRES